MKQKQVLFILVGAIVLMLGGQLSTPIQRARLQQEIAHMQRRGYSVKFLDNTLVELTEPMTGAKRLKSLLEPSESEIRAWAARRGTPILEIDPTTIDTSRFTGRYRPWSKVPLSQWSPAPLVVADLNNNDKVEVYGIFWRGATFRSLVYEVDRNGDVTVAHEYIPYLSRARRYFDFDVNSLFEVYYTSRDTLYSFEQPNIASLPVNRKFVFATSVGDVAAQALQEYMGDIDGDSASDYLYRGAVPDSALFVRYITAVAIYDSTLPNLHRVWTGTLFGNTDAFLGGYEVNDFDNDGRRDFVSSDLLGRVAAAGNTGRRSYEIVWKDSVPFVNVYYLGSGDIDRDGLPEFFVGATVGSGDWTTVFEADGDNRYSARLLIHLLAGGTFDHIQYVCRDVNGDGIQELIICAGADIFFFNSKRDNEYYLSYLQRENARDAIQFYDFNGDGKLDFIVGKNLYIDSTNTPYNEADIYLASNPNAVAEKTMGQTPDEVILYQSYPNPFNPTTKIEFFLASPAKVQLTIFDVQGREVEVLISDNLEAGRHSIPWSGNGKSSGVYFCKLYALAKQQVRKVILVH
jgi:hypothetical protein